MSKLQHFLEISHHNLNFVKIWPEKQIFWGVALVQVQWLRTVTRYGLDNLKQCCKRIKTKSQKILRTNCMDVELTWENQPGGALRISVKRALIAWKVSKYRVFSGPYFPAFGLNPERYGVSLCIWRDTEGDKSPRWG